MIRFPVTLGQVSASPGELRAGGTDLSERHATGVADGPIVDLRDVPGLRAVTALDGAVRIGALTTLADVVASPAVRAAAPALVEALEGTATPQIRGVGTVGGNLMQRVRCWYYRHPDVPCLKKGGTHCYARAGDHRLHSCIDLGPCLAPHPSTLALALLAYDGRVHTYEAGPRTMAAFFGDGADPFRENSLRTREVVTHVELPAAPPEGAAYVRAKERRGSEWPLVDAVARVAVEDGVVTRAVLALGHAANRSLRLPAVEEALTGGPATEAAVAAAAALAVEGVVAPPMTRYKLPLVVGVAQTALEIAMRRAS